MVKLHRQPTSFCSGFCTGSIAWSYFGALTRFLRIVLNVDSVIVLISDTVPARGVYKVARLMQVR